MVYPWEQDYQDQGWDPQAIDQFGPYAPGPYDQPAVLVPPPAQSYGMAMLPSPGQIGDWLGSAASAIGGGGVGNYSGPDTSQARPPAAGAGSWRAPKPSPMGLPNVGPQQNPVYDALEPANAALLAALQPRDNSPEAIRKRLGFSWGGGADSLGANGRPAIDSTVHDQYGGMPVQAHESTGGGGFSQSKIEDMPWGQRPQSWRNDQAEQIQFGLAQAGLQKAQYEAQDPTGVHAYQQRQAIDMHMKAADRKAQMDADLGQFSLIAKNRDDSLRQIESDPTSRLLPEAEKVKLRGQIEEKFRKETLQYTQARDLSRPGPLNTKLFDPNAI